MTFPALRMRRMRRVEPLRSLVRENRVDVTDLIYPLFVADGERVRNEVPSMPGVSQISVDGLRSEATDIARLGIPGVILFGIPDEKDSEASQAYASDGVIQRAIREIKSSVPELIVMTDVCLCEYTDHGHCGVVVDGEIDNDKSLPLLAKMALSHAEAGADVLAPSDMMDGRVRALRDALDAGGFSNLPILSYAAKYASGFYGPFREAAQSTPQFGDRRSYQMDPANVREALVEVDLDLHEGADMVMVKPALAYLDVIRRVRDRFDCPLAAYNVSGEYSMVKAAAAQGWIDEKRTVLEILTAIKRAGADIILTYHAKDFARWAAMEKQGR
jgi:porphobilinogen synthase